jgi:hypothetical protein
LPSNAQLVHQELQSISGVGPKIASFFMRDVACRYDCFPAATQERYLLQPVDVWVRRVAESLGAPAVFADPRPAASFIVEQSLDAGITPERVNQGMWYFSAEVAGTEYYLSKLFADPLGISRARKDLCNHLHSLASSSSLLESLCPPPVV